MAKTAEKTDPALWERVKAEITAGDKGGDAGEWSARKAQMAVQAYKKRGGGYKGRMAPDINDSIEANLARIAEAKRRGIAGRSRMSKAELERALAG